MPEGRPGSLRADDAGMDDDHAVAVPEPAAALADVHAVTVDLLDDRDVPVQAVRGPASAADVADGRSGREGDDAAGPDALLPVMGPGGRAPVASVAPGALAEIMPEGPLPHARPPSALQARTAIHDVVAGAGRDGRGPHPLDLALGLADVPRPVARRGGRDRGRRGGGRDVLASGEEVEHIERIARAGRHDHAEGRGDGKHPPMAGGCRMFPCHVSRRRSCRYTRTVSDRRR